jgi:hypothetical protein
MANRFTAAMSILVDFKAEEGADIKNIIESLECTCTDKTGEANVIGVDIVDRRIVVDVDEPDAE